MINRLNINPFRRRSGVGVCSILATAKQYISLWVDDLLTDTLGRGYLQPLQSWAFKFDGTTNYVNSGLKVTGGKPIYLDTLIYPDLSIAGGIMGCGAAADTQKGAYIRYYIATGILFVKISDGTTGTVHAFTSASALVGNQWNRLKLTWDGVAGHDITVDVDGRTESKPAVRSWVGDSFSELTVGRSASNGFFFKGIVAFADIEINNLGLSRIVCATGDGNKIYDVDYNIERTVLGTVNASNWVKQDEYHYNILNGFNKIGDAYIPASRTNLGFDVLGNTLSNPAVKGHNGAETLLKQGDDTVKLIDTHNEWFDTSGVAIEHSFSTLPVNGIRVRGVYDGLTNRSKFVTFDHDLTTDEKSKIDKCIYQSITIPSGYRIAYDSDGLVMHDANNEIIFTHE